MNIKTKNEELDRLSLTDFKRSKKAPVYVVLDNVRSAQNVGSIFRTMDAFRCAGIYICGISATPPHREINKTALGATESVDWKYFENTRDAIIELREKKNLIYAVEQTKDAIFLNDFEPNFEHKIAFIFGNEITGVDQDLVNSADGSIEIPQFGSKHSINIAVCAGIVLWHTVKGFDFENGKSL